METISIKIKMPTEQKDGNGKAIRKEKTFIATDVPGRLLRRAIEFQSLKDLDESAFNVETLDGMINYIVELFGNKFTLDDVYDGIAVENIFPEMMRCITAVVKRFMSKVGNLPNAESANQ